MPEDIDGFGGDEDGSGSGGYFPTPVQSTPRRSRRGPIILILIGGVMALLSGLAALGGGGEKAFGCITFGLFIAALGVCELAAPQDKRDSLV